MLVGWFDVSARSWSVVIKAPTEWINSNDRRDRRGDPRRRIWRDAANVYARAARLPKLGRAHITAELRFRDRRRRDSHNYYPTLKAVIDGLVDYGLLDDDSSEYLVGPDIRLGPVTTTAIGELVLTIKEAAG